MPCWSVDRQRRTTPTIACPSTTTTSSPTCDSASSCRWPITTPISGDPAAVGSPPRWPSSSPSRCQAIWIGSISVTTVGSTVAGRAGMLWPTSASGRRCGFSNGRPKGVPPGRRRDPPTSRHPAGHPDRQDAAGGDPRPARPGRPRRLAPLAATHRARSRGRARRRRLTSRRRFPDVRDLAAAPGLDRALPEPASPSLKRPSLPRLRRFPLVGPPGMKWRYSTSKTKGAGASRTEPREPAAPVLDHSAHLIRRSNCNW